MTSHSQSITRQNLKDVMLKALVSHLISKQMIAADQDCFADNEAYNE